MIMVAICPKCGQPIAAEPAEDATWHEPILWLYLADRAHECERQETE